MAKGNDWQHFEDYREQTQVKHEILAAYLPAYFHILKAGSKNLLYIDGFAGRGTYTKSDTGDVVDGSPLRALKLIADEPAFHGKVFTIFIESDKHLFDQLESAVGDFYSKNSQIRQPVVMHGIFSERVTEVMTVVNGKLAPAFLFVDPCGVSGTKFDTIRAVMNCDKCEAFIFFNVDGVRRIAGIDKLSDVLIDLMGSKDRAQALYDSLRQTTDVAKREALILSHYKKALVDDVGAKYITDFRIEHEDKQKTSHYLIHATKHPLGFRIMKDVMWRRGHSDDQQGALQFAQASRTNYIPLFNMRDDAIKKAITDELAKGARRVSLFCTEWVERPTDLLCEPAYKRVLLELEAKGVIAVISKDGKNVVPAVSRPRPKGKQTLANDYWVRLKQ